MSTPYRVLVVCVANICRSPVAEALLQHHLPALQVSSAGLSAPEGQPAHPQMCQLLQDRGIDLCGHRSRPIAPWMLQQNDLIMVMEQDQRTDLAKRNPTFRGKIFLLGEFLKLDIVDPVEQPLAVFEQCVHNIERSVQSWVTPLQSMSRRF